MPKISSDCFINRELSWLEFNNRVLMQALSVDNPLFERLRFLSIVCSNLDEFYMIRVSSLYAQISAKSEERDPAGLTAKQQLSAVSRRASILMDTAYGVYHSLMGELAEEGIHLLHYEELTDSERSFCEEYYRSSLYPLITPTVLGKGRVFPLVSNGGLNLAVTLRRQDGSHRLATVSVPTGLGRLVRLEGDEVRFVAVEEIVRANIGSLFPGWEITESRVYRVTRDGDLELDEDDYIDLRSAVMHSLSQRKRGRVMRLELEAGVSGALRDRLMRSLKVTRKQVFELGGPVNLTFLSKAICSLDGFEHLKYKPYTPSMPECLRDTDDIFSVMRERDVLLYHPFDSFDPVVRFLRQAAADEQVMAIKITLYRVSHESPIVAALKQAARSGKDVTVLFEARARFDEENNIEFGAELSAAGASVIYGLPHVKTHSKIALVMRRENGATVNYVHLGTGNYNDVTARLYTDYSLLTADKRIGSDASEFFHSLTGGLYKPEPVLLVAAPHDMRDRFVHELKRERKRAKHGLPAEVFVKINSLTDRKMIKQLYKASRAGVHIRLLVRGICCLRPGIPGLSENIEVRSIVGRFLEHSRIYSFGTGDERRLYLSSADWMTRNLDRRVELLFPLLDSDVRQKVISDCELYWSDNVKARVMNSNGQYFPTESAEDQINAQEALIRSEAQAD